jgi:predicted enzyme related to lactoylglutathione lyase
MTSDQAGAAEFYGDLFGWTAEDPNPEFGGYQQLLHEGLPVAGCMPKMGDNPMPDVWGVYLASDDVDRVAKETEAAGGNIIAEPMDVGTLGRMLIVTDPAGAIIGSWTPNDFAGIGVHDEPNTPGWFELWTRDFNVAKQYYTDVFGWPLHLTGDTDEFRYATYGKNDAALAGIMDASSFLPDGVPAHWSVYFRIENADATLKKIEQLGGKIVVPAEDTPYGRLATASDPWGAIFKLLQ